MVVESIFNGKGFIRPISKTAATHHFEIQNFSDASSKFNGTNIQLGDIVFVRSLSGVFFRLIVSEIKRKSPFSLELLAIDVVGNLGNIVPQNVAIFRETLNHQYPQFPNGIPSVMRAALESHYAILADVLDSCNGTLITASQITGSETMCLKNANGSESKILISELRKYFHTFEDKMSQNWLFTTNNNGQLLGNTPPQY